MLDDQPLNLPEAELPKEATPVVDVKAQLMATLQGVGSQVISQFTEHAATNGLENFQLHHDALNAWLSQVLGFAYMHDITDFQLDSGMQDLPYKKPDGTDGNYLIWNARFIHNGVALFATSVTFSFSYGSQ